MEKLKKKWGIESNFQIVIIFIVFSINGSIALYLANPLTNFFNLSKETTAPLIYWPVRIILVFVIYQITLVIVGAIFYRVLFRALIILKYQQYQ